MDKKAVILLAVVIVVVLVVLSVARREKASLGAPPGGGLPQPVQPVPGPSPPADGGSQPGGQSLGPGDYDLKITYDGMQRGYLAHVPQSYTAGEDMPAVFVFHGGGGSPEGMVGISGMNAVADENGFIAVYPRGTRRDLGSGQYNRLWNVEEGPSGAYYNKGDVISTIDDVGFFGAMLDDLEGRFSVDANRVYLAGLSNGGMLSHLLACRYSDRIAAIAPVAGPFWNYPDECAVSRPVSVMYFHGTTDPCAPYEGGLVGCSSAAAGDTAQRVVISAEETVGIWREKDGCPEESATTYQNGGATCRTYSCERGSEVAFCSIEGGGHTWPGGGPRQSIPGMSLGEISQDISASEEMWKFFEKHPMP